MNRYEDKDLRKCHLETMLGSVGLKQRYYLDKETKEYVYLLDKVLYFKGNKPISPFLEEVAVF